MIKTTAKKYSKGWLLFIAGFIIALFIGWVVFPQILYSSRQQPFQFNHAVHGKDGAAALSCEDCHQFREDGSYMGIPKLESCFDCHAEVQGNSEAEKVFVKDAKKLLDKGKEIPWLVYSKQPPCVYFSHAAHIELGKIACAQCHQDLSKAKALPAYKKNRISGYSKFVEENMKMDDCADCHNEKGVSNACFVCHK